MERASIVHWLSYLLSNPDAHRFQSQHSNNLYWGNFYVAEVTRLTERLATGQRRLVNFDLAQKLATTKKAYFKIFKS